MKVINENKRLLFTLKEKTSGPLVVTPEELILVEESLKQTPGGGGSETRHSYSTNETLTGGTWIDGKPIYRKVYVSTTNASGSTIIGIPEGYIKQLVNATIIIEEGLNLQYVINPKIEYDVDALKFTNSTDSSPFNLILEYTKTTD